MNNKMVPDWDRKMKQLYTRRQFLKKSLSFMISGFVSTTIGYLYARFIEPKQLVTTNHVISHPLIPKSFDGVKIVQFSDTHLGHFYDLKQLERIVHKINELNPDLVVFTGDLIDEPNKYPDTKQIIPILKKIEARLGKFSIYGNHDHGGYGTEIYLDIMNRANFKTLINEHVIIELLDKSKIAIAGLDDMMLGKPNFSAMTRDIPPNTYTIALLHEPDGANITASFPVHLQLSGHSHGGQIQIPFLGPLVTPPLAVKYYEGFYKINDLTLYVNRGLGTTRMPFRFFSLPELTVFTLKHQRG
ncbi:hypothetical protein HNQ85_000883 [Anoxybacillus calidus]|uniref:Calcineurin-like phosphoesterase domain-containing protein n=1 Tax=[Anoxybacillus] calidus TaxID=575178 RepID=A0A7V9YYH7_9BACL|nr:hypothetical protein [Anoxybacillus calidus]